MMSSMGGMVPTMMTMPYEACMASPAAATPITTATTSPMTTRTPPPPPPGLEDMVPLPPLNLAADPERYSQGAALHPEQCKPCAWFWKKAGGGGCDSGAACIFCHMCEDGALKQRKKDKAMRARKER